MNIEQDKILHFALSFLIVLFAYLICKNVLIASIFSFVIGIIKEIYDYFHPKHTFDIKDIFADILGILLAVILL